MMLSASAKSSLAVSRSSLQNASRTVGGTRGFAKQVKFGVEGRSAMLRGVDMLADAVQVSLHASYSFSLLKIPFFRRFGTLSTEEYGIGSSKHEPNGLRTRISFCFLEHHSTTIAFARDQGDLPCTSKPLCSNGFSSYFSLPFLLY
jgi:hypothetical protein